MTTQLTGRRRHRIGLFGRLVLQVECCGDRYHTLTWRDATAADVTTEDAPTEESRP